MKKTEEMNIGVDIVLPDVLPDYVCEMKVVDGFFINLTQMPNWWNRLWIKWFLGFEFRRLK